MALEENGIFGEEKSTISIKERISGYLAYWPLFLVCTLVCLGAGVFYARYTVPKYMANVSFLVKRADANSGDLIESALNGKGQGNLNSEMLLINSAGLMQRTVAKHNFNIIYLKKGTILNIDIYRDAPFTLTALPLTDSNSTYNFYIKEINNSGGSFSSGPEKGEKVYSFQWNKPFIINKQNFILSPKGAIQNDDDEYIVIWKPIRVAASELKNNFTVIAPDSKTSLIQLSLKTENLQKGKDVLNALFTEFNLADIEERTKLSENTVQFIDERLLAISKELTSVEGNLENFQGSKQLINIGSQTGTSLGNSDAASKTITDLAVQKGITSMISDYFSNPSNSDQLVPSSLGLQDGTLASLINQYNDLQLKKKREAPLVAPNSTVMQDLNTQLGNIKSSIMESLGNLQKNLQLRENSVQQERNQYRGFLSTVPHNERVLQEIRRKQSITEGLYLYLLQKREETAISSTGASVSHYKQIDLATGYGPVEPNTRNIIIYGALMGFFLAFSWVFMKDQLLNDKINSKADITSKIAVPLIGQVSHIPKKSKDLISVLGRNLAGEEFRSIRTKLSFLLKNKKEKVILVTSSLSNEGKSFVSINLAAVCAITGKKVALLEFDIRNPSIANNLKLDSSKGLTNFLAGDVNTLSEICYTIDELPSLHIYPSGSDPLNAADMLLSNNISNLFENLKKDYDFVIIDSPPVGLVSDAFLLEPYCDIVLYILRQQATSKSQLDVIKDIKSSNSLKNMQLILNDVKTGNTNTAYYSYNKDHSYGKNQNGKTKKKAFASFFNF